MRKAALATCLALGLAGRLAAGTVSTLDGHPDESGKLTLDSAAIHLDSGPDVPLANVLEAAFTDAPFQLSTFTSTGANADKLPANWQHFDTEKAQKTGAYDYTKGVLALQGPVTEEAHPSAHALVVGPWAGDGQWTCRVTEVNGRPGETSAGLVLRESTDADTQWISLEATAATAGDSSTIVIETVEGRKVREHHHASTISSPFPVWLRLARNGSDVDGYLSTDGVSWELIYQHRLLGWEPAWAGFTIDGHPAKFPGDAKIDNITFTPGPCAASELQPGVLLRSGSFIAGALSWGAGKAESNAPASLIRGPDRTDRTPLPIADIGTFLLHATDRSRLTAAEAKVGLIMKNGDFLEGEFAAISPMGVTMNSVLLGISDYKEEDIQAGVMAPVQPAAAPYEVRLFDGSRILANSLSVNGSSVAIGEVSGFNLEVQTSDIAQFRAGPATTQAMLALPWKAAAPGAKPDAAPPALDCWQGPAQEQMLVVPSGTAVTFSLDKPYRELAARLGVAPDGPAGAKVAVRLLADGNAVGMTPPFQAGDPLRSIRAAVPRAKSVTFVVDSTPPGAKVLLIDPTAIR